MIYRLTNSGLVGVPKWGSKPLNFFTFHKATINPPDENQNDSNISIVEFRFHSSKAFCQKTAKEHAVLHGGVHARYFVYNGVDKTEQELIEWALNTDQVANDGVTKIYGATKMP